jgi:hydrogenase maturation protease
MFTGMDSPGAGFGRLVVGIGNDFRGDDAAGLLAVRRLAELNLSGVKIVEFDGDSAALMELWKGLDLIIVVDAVSSGEKPGRIYRFEPINEPLPGGLFSKSSTHDFGLMQAIELSRALGAFPKRVIVYGIEGTSFEPGSKISEGVASAIEKVILKIRGDLV